MSESKPITKICTVCVGIPTYNRLSSLRRAISSVLNQDYSDIKLIISDNASNDQTEKFCTDLTAKEKKVTYIRQSRNLGASENFIEVFNKSDCEYFMWLGDDDFIDRSYISRCVKILSSDKDISLVGGRAKYYSNDKYAYDGKVINLTQQSAYLRVLSYYSQVTDNGTFYGVMRRNLLSEIKIANTIGSDWLIIAAMAFSGKLITLDDVSVHRQLGGATENYKKMATSLGLPQLEQNLGRMGRMYIAINAFKNILWQTQIFQRIGKIRRLMFASTVFVLIFIKKALLIYVARFIRAILMRIGIWDRLRLSKL